MTLGLTFLSIEEEKMTSKRELGFLNASEVATKDGRNRVLDLMFADGFGPDEAMDYAEEYARIICGLASPTAVKNIKRHIRSTLPQ